MGKNLQKPLCALSLGLNLAFIAVWLAHSLSAPGGAGGLSPSAVDSLVPSELHREIGVTEQQWRMMEPWVRDFQKKAAEQRQSISALRGQLMDLLILPVADEAALREKQEEILAGQRRMQNLVIDHLLREKELLSPEQGRKLMESLCEQCRDDGGMVSGKGPGRALDERTGRVPDKEETGSR